MRVTLFLAILAWPIASATAQEAKAVIVTPDATQWGAAPAMLPAGAKVAVLDGDPTKPGLFTMRLSVPDGYRIPPHFHPVDEHVTVISGKFQVGMGDTFDGS
jgi:ChrR-like protein with cupin domain